MGKWPTLETVFDNMKITNVNKKTPETRYYI
jgi:hypothetical protein